MVAKAREPVNTGRDERDAKHARRRSARSGWGTPRIQPRCAARYHGAMKNRTLIDSRPGHADG